MWCKITFVSLLSLIFFFWNFIAALIYMSSDSIEREKGAISRNEGTGWVESSSRKWYVLAYGQTAEVAMRCGAARRYVAPYRACNMHVSIRTLSNISFRSIYPNALSCGRLSRCELYSISRFPSVCWRRARHKQARRCKKASVPRTYRITMTRKKRQQQLVVQSSLCPTSLLYLHLELSTGTSTLARVRSIVRRGA